MIEKDVEERFLAKLGDIETARKNLQETMQRVRDGTISLTKAQALKGMASVEVEFFRSELQILSTMSRSHRDVVLELLKKRKLLEDNSTEGAGEDSEENPQERSIEEKENPALRSTSTGYLQRIKGDDGIVRERHTIL